MTDTVMRPAAPAERIALLDVLRGFALLGILLVNNMGGSGELLPRLDEFVSGAIDWAGEASFYPLFSFLFGAGFAIQFERLRQRSGRPSLLSFRRMLALFLIATLHNLFGGVLDILLDYAVLGVVLILLVRLGQRTLLVFALVLLVLQVGPVRPGPAFQAWRNQHRSTVSVLNEAARSEDQNVQMYSAPPRDSLSYGGKLAADWHDYTRFVRGYGRVPPTRWLPELLLAMIAGVLVARARLLQDAVKHRRKFLLGLAVAVLLVATADSALVINRDLPRGQGPVVWVSNWGVTLLYICALTLVFTFTQAGTRLLGYLAPAGRMALTNYLLQSLFILALGKFDPGAALMALLNVAFFTLQVLASRWWLSRFQFGPAEWLWRSITYGTLQPMHSRTRPFAPAPRVLVNA